jgi:hypothetical protein
MGHRGSGGSEGQDRMLADSNSSWRIVCRQSLLGSESQASIRQLYKLVCDATKALPKYVPSEP